MKTTADLFKEGARRGPELTLALGEAWRAFREGRASVADYDLIIGDLQETSGYYYVTLPGTSSEELRHREGARSVFARILFLLDVPLDKFDEMRRAALVELDITNQEGER